MESEYVALTEAAKEAAFLRKLLKSLNLAQTAPTLILTDSESALKNVKNNINHSRAKHIATRHHYIRMAYNTGEVDIRHVPSASQTADILTKPLGILKHAEAVKLLMLQDTRYISRCMPFHYLTLASNCRSHITILLASFLHFRKSLNFHVLSCLLQTLMSLAKHYAITILFSRE